MRPLAPRLAEQATTPIKRPVIAYFVYDLGDQAVPRRLDQLVEGGADVILFGFSRVSVPPTHVGGVPAISLGRTRESKFVDRMLAVARALLRTPRWRALTRDADAFVGRNLECLAVAAAARRRGPLVYEVLDIHRLLVETGLRGRFLRWIEGSLLKRCALIVTSSPAFVRMHLSRYRARADAVVVENKVVDTVTNPAPASPGRRRDGPPWRIGWFGRLRCRRSLMFLSELAKTMDGAIEIDLRGTIDLPLRDLFDDVVSSTPCMTYHGRYTYDDLADIYGRVHFSWAIDFFEEGLNSSWLLPNRLYEGCLNGAIPIAMNDVETGRWFSRHEIGIVCPSLSDVEQALATMTVDLYDSLVSALKRLPRSLFVTDEREAKDLVARIVSAF